MKSVLKFLKKAEAEVHGLQATSAEMEVLLREFAEGRLSDSQRKQVCAWLRQHPERMAEVAAVVKGCRPVAPPK